MNKGKNPKSNHYKSLSIENPNSMCIACATRIKLDLESSQGGSYSHLDGDHLEAMLYINH